MSGDESAYAVLGLRPGAGRAEVELAYRRLIKRYHPDMAGGDGGRAAEINRAYTQLRRHGAAPPRNAPRRRVPVPVERRPARRGRRTGLILIGVVAIASAVAVGNDVPRRGPASLVHAVPAQWSPPAYQPTRTAADSPLPNFEEPLQTAVIDRAITDATRFHTQGDPAAAAEFSRACHDRLRKDPSLTWFDSCAAFDEATVALSSVDPLEMSGQFDASSVVARQMGAARLLSDDTMAADSRLRQIRSRVEFALVPRLDEAAAQKL